METYRGQAGLTNPDMSPCRGQQPGDEPAARREVPVRTHHRGVAPVGCHVRDDVSGERDGVEPSWQIKFRLAVGIPDASAIDPSPQVVTRSPTTRSGFRQPGDGQGHRTPVVANKSSRRRWRRRRGSRLGAPGSGIAARSRTAGTVSARPSVDARAATTPIRAIHGAPGTRGAPKNVAAGLWVTRLKRFCNQPIDDPTSWNIVEGRNRIPVRPPGPTAMRPPSHCPLAWNEYSPFSR